MMNLNELVGKKMSFTDLDDKMMDNGFYSIADDGVANEIKESGCAYYESKNGDLAVVISFEVLADLEYGDIELLVTAAE